MSTQPNGKRGRYFQPPQMFSHPRPLYDLKSEAEALACAIIDPATMRGPLSKLSVSDFVGSDNQAIFGIMLKLAEEGGNFDILDVAETWKGHEGADDGIAYLGRLMEGIPYTPSIVPRCVERLQKFAQLRRYQRLGDAVQREAERSDADPAVLGNKIQMAMDGIQAGYDLDGELLPYAPKSLTRHANLLTLSSVEAKAVDWMWEPYLIRGMLGMLSGDPGAGKTYIAMALAAALTQGRTPYKGDPCLPVDVIYMSSENDPECVVRPRFDLLEGNPARFHLLLGSVVGEGDKVNHQSITLSDVVVLEEALKKTESKLLIVDPIQSYLGAEVDAHRSNETRPVLDGLARLAKQYCTCILILRHFAKSTTGHAIHRGLGSIDLTGAVRTEMHAGTRDNQRALVHAKANMGEMGKSLGYEISNTGFRWTGEVSITANDLAAIEPAEEDRDAVEEAMTRLELFLQQSPKTAKEVFSEFRGEISEATLRRAKSKLKVKSRKIGEAWQWTLEDDAAQN